MIRTRYSNVILGGVLAGIGGAYFTIGSIGEFTTDMTAGLGFVALAAMIFGRWRPYGALGAALLFGFAESLQSVLGVLNVGIPAPLLVDGAVRDHDRRRLGPRRPRAAACSRRQAVLAGVDPPAAGVGFVLRRALSACFGSGFGGTGG